MSKSYSRGHANRGRKLELLVEMTNNQYRAAGRAVVNHIPTPTKIKKVEGDKVEAKLGKAAFVDYIGVCNGKSIVFDAKETKQERFPLANLASHQYQILEMWHKHGAESFLLIAFWLKGKNEPEIYVLSFEQLKRAWEDSATKSIPLSYFREHCTRVVSQNFFTVDYLGALNL